MLGSVLPVATSCAKWPRRCATTLEDKLQINFGYVNWMLVFKNLTMHQDLEISFKTVFFTLQTSSIISHDPFLRIPITLKN